jgi:dsRNA-specific ribonuclease
MSQQLNELEQRIGYYFHNRDHLRRALTSQSAVNERHPDATNQNFQALEFVGDAALKYAVATLLFNQQNGQWSAGNIHDNVVQYIRNDNLSRIGRELNLSEYIIKGNGVIDITDKMLADAVESILGAIVIDQQQQELNGSDNVLLNVVARLWSINRKGKQRILPPVQHGDEKNTCCCCCGYSCGKCFGIFCIILLVLSLIIMAVFSFKNADL